MLRHLELIDDEALEFGVRIVKIADQLMAKKYGHRIPPGLGYFRQGNYLKYDGRFEVARASHKSWLMMIMLTTAL